MDHVIPKSKGGKTDWNNLVVSCSRCNTKKSDSLLGETNLKLKPIYSYNRIYYGGSELQKHVDRDSCEISASIGLNFHYENTNYKWPLCMGDMPIIIKPGDGVIYKGAEIEHWRPIFTQPTNCWHHQLFIHYVDLNGPFANLQEESNQENIKNNLDRSLSKI